ncbi:MAG: hypothetical protein AB7P99_16395 [Vicinamibacterales bacterium]
MPYTIPYESGTFRPPSAIIPGNDESAEPVEFELVPAEGEDQARLKSVIYATAGMANQQWGPEIQRTVIEAFRSAKGLFDQTVPVVRNLSVPYALAVRAGLVEAPAPGRKATETPAEVPVRTGRDFTKVQGFMPPLAFLLAMEIAKLGRGVDLDARFFEPASTRSEASDPAASSTAPGAPSPPAAAATAESPTP